MPTPLSVTASITYWPGTTSTWVAAYCSSRWTLAVSMVSLPPLGHRVARVDREIEDRDFQLVGVGHARATGRRRARSRPRSARPASAAESDMPVTSRPTSIGFGSRGCWREKASSRCVSDSARRAPRIALSADRCSRSTSTSVVVKMALQRFKIADDDGQQIVEIVGDAACELADRLPSSATGAARSSAARRSVRSRVTLAKPSSSPCCPGSR